MNGLLRAAMTATQLGALYESARVKPRRILISLAAGCVAAVFVIAALFWFDAALWFYCEPKYGAPIAALISGGALVVAALIALLPIMVRPRAAPPPPPQSLAVSLATTEVAVAAIREVTKLIQEHKGALMIAAAIGGVVLGSGKRK